VGFFYFRKEINPMIRTILIGAMVLVLALSWSMECAEGVAVNQDGFYVIVAKKKNYAPLAKTGQTTSYATGDDGDLEKGVTWPSPRFTDNGNGTVTDNLTGLIWLKNANCTCFYSGDTTGQNQRDWSGALTAANSLANGYCGLTDGSVAGDWRLPNVRELQSLIHYGFHDPAVPNTAGTGKWTSGDPFTNVQSWLYWSSSKCTGLSGDYVLHVDTHIGCTYELIKTHPNTYVWPVRGGN
jgi:hypothetical protein